MFPNAFSLLSQPILSPHTLSLRDIIPPQVPHSVPSSLTNRKCPTYLGTLFWHGDQETGVESLRLEVTFCLLGYPQAKGRPGAEGSSCCPLPSLAASRLTPPAKRQWGSKSFFPKGSRKQSSQLKRYDNFANLVPLKELSLLFRHWKIIFKCSLASSFLPFLFLLFCLIFVHIKSLNNSCLGILTPFPLVSPSFSIWLP